MRSGFKLGKLFGIQIRVDWSWLLIFFLTTWNLATAFGGAHGQWNPALRWGIAVLGALLFFLSVLAHELAHSLVAQSRGMSVQSIRLHLFGGVSNIQQEPPSPSAEFTMAALGPLTSLVIGTVLLLGVNLTTDMPTTRALNPQNFLANLSPIQTIVAWLGSVNVILGLFNLIPGFPLDGGRVLRSIFWGVTDNLRQATQWASFIGRGIAWLLIFGGISMAFGVSIPVFGTGFINGLWLAFIGWFMHNAAVQSYQQLIIRDILEDVPVSQLMRKDPPTVSTSTTVDTLIHSHIMQSDDHAFPVLEHRQLRGIVTLDDVRAVNRDAWNATSVDDIMTPVDQLSTVSPDDCADVALTQLIGTDVRQLPVLDDQGQLQGVLRRRDILKWLQLEADVSIG
jgi:Zn-dependent protease/CBS domain-containing protein